MLFLSGFLWKISNARQRKASETFFPLISGWSFLKKSAKLHGETIIFIEGLLPCGAITDCLFAPFASFLSGRFMTIWEWQFLWQEMSYYRASIHIKITMSKSVKFVYGFFANHVPKATSIGRYSSLPRFVEILYLSYLYVKFQPSHCIFTPNFHHFPCSPNYVSGVINTCARIIATTS